MTEDPADDRSLLTAPPPKPRLLGRLGAIAAIVVLAGVLGTVVAVGLDRDDRPQAPRSTLLGATRVQAPTLAAGAPVPPPTGPVVLTLRDVPRPNVGADLQLDIDQLDALGVWSMSADDRQATGREARFSGPLLRDVLAAAGIADARTLHTVAVNDYRVDIPVRDALRLPVLLATRTDGERMDVADYGPVRVVYPTSRYDLEPTVYEPRWIWQLTTISFD